MAIAAALLAAGCMDDNDFVDAPDAWPYSLPLGGPDPTALTAVNAFPMLALTQPLFATHPPDGSDRIFVLEKPGRIVVFPNDPAITSATVFLDIRSQVSDFGEEGLLGLAFDPDYATSGEFYINYIAPNPLRTVVARYRVSADPNVADAASEEILFTVAQPFSNHNGGMLAFGPDDMLYISLGDGGAGGDPFGNGQNLTTLLGNVLRIDPNSGSPYAIPPDNPFVGAGSGEREEIWAYGFRNPWRFSFDRQTGELWLGDVGQGDREEIDIVVKGGNYGWSFYEGSSQFSNPGSIPASAFEPPVWDYSHAVGDSVTGGYVYRGTLFPELRGAYIYGDYGSGVIWALVRNGGTTINTTLSRVGQIASFGEDQAGELLLVSLSGNIFRFERSVGGGDPFPARLSETGLFRDVANLVPDRQLHEYQLNSPLWSDGAIKTRWVASPLAPITFHPTDDWTFPIGTVLVKHFELETTVGDPFSRRRLETRVMLRDFVGWSGYTYKWNDQQTDADLLGGRFNEVHTINDPFAPGGQRQQTWTYPNRTDCLLCHTDAWGRALGPRTRQLNKIVRGNTPINRLTTFGVLEGASPAATYEAYPDPADPMLTYAERARSYLAVNCAVCHVPGGLAPTFIDLRWDIPEADMNLIDVRPSNGNLGLPDPWLILPGSKESSVLWQRMNRTNGDRMPPIGSHEIDPLGIEVIGGWIDTMR